LSTCSDFDDLFAGTETDAQVLNNTASKCNQQEKNVWPQRLRTDCKNAAQISTHLNTSQLSADFELLISPHNVWLG